MRIARLEGARRLRVADAPVPSIGPDEVLLRVSHCGVCASEVDMWNGTADSEFPLWPGHEVSGGGRRCGR